MPGEKPQSSLAQWENSKTCVNPSILKEPIPTTSLRTHACLVNMKVNKVEQALNEIKRILCFLSTDSSSTSSLVGSPSHVVPPDGKGATLSATGNNKKNIRGDFIVQTEYLIKNVLVF